MRFHHPARNRYRAALPFVQGFHDLVGADAGDQLFGEHMMCVAKHFLGDQVSVRGVIWSKC